MSGETKRRELRLFVPVKMVFELCFAAGILFAITSSLEANNGGQQLNTRGPTDINNGTITHYACEHNKLQMSCGENESICVVEANYGRRAYEICNEDMPNKPTHWDTNCSMANKSLSVVRRLCDRKSSCTVFGSNSFFGDPCEGTEKYLEVTYQCIPKLVCSPHCSQHGCDVAGEYKCDECDFGYGLTANGTCDACSAHCRRRGCDVAGAFKCDQCDYGFSLTDNGTCNETRGPTDINYACEVDELRLSCRENETIRVVNANYGRSDNQSCSGAMIYEPAHYFVDCAMKMFLSTVRHLCNRKSNCTVIASKWILAHHCGDIDIYVEVAYKCMPIWECSMYCTEYHCDVAGEYKCDRCDFGYGIAANGSCHACSAHCRRRGCNVAGAFKCDRCDYGFSLTANGTCESYVETTRKPTDIINGTITNYQIVCQNEDLQISCRENERINVVDANYGRLTPHICNGYMPNDTLHWSVNCSSNRSMSVVRRRCDEKSSCWVYATIGFFGDPCPGTEKYLEVTYQCKSVIGLEPTFDVPIVNVTVVKGQTAVLPCSIEQLGKFKVAWLDRNAIPLTYEDRRIIDDTRFSIIRPYVREWNLQIRDIRRDDEGQYRCAINTNPTKSKLVMLYVKANTSKEDTTNGVYSMAEPSGIQFRRGRIHYSALTAWMTPESQISITTQPVDQKLCQDPQVYLGLGISGVFVILVLVIIIVVLFFKNRSLRKVKREFDNESQHSLNTYEEVKMQKHHQDYERTRLCDSSSTAWI